MENLKSKVDQECGSPKSFFKLTPNIWRAISIVLICFLLVVSDLIFRLFDQKFLAKLLKEEQGLVQLFLNLTTNE